MSEIRAGIDPKSPVTPKGRRMAKSKAAMIDEGPCATGAGRRAAASTAGILWRRSDCSTGRRSAKRKGYGSCEAPARRGIVAPRRKAAGRRIRSFRTGQLAQRARQQPELPGSRRRPAPSQPDPPGPRRFEPGERDPGPPGDLCVDSQARRQRDSDSRRHHLHQRVQAARLELSTSKNNFRDCLPRFAYKAAYSR